MTHDDDTPRLYGTAVVTPSAALRIPGFLDADGSFQVHPETKRIGGLRFPPGDFRDFQPADYGTPPEPKYGRRAEPKHIGVADCWPAAAPEWTPEQIEALRKALGPGEEPLHGVALPEPTRSPAGMRLAALFLVIAAVLGWGASQGAWWGLLWFPFAFFAFFGVFGLWYDSRKTPRDGDGIPLP